MGRRLARFAGMRVLIVDDNQVNVDLLTSVLNREGLNGVDTETDSRRVADRLPVLKPDLVLLDLRMPHLDGHAVLETISRFAAGSYLPVLVLTADATTEARDLALANGARDFLTKPFDITEVALRVANLLETRELYVNARGRTADSGASSENDGSTQRRIAEVLRHERIRPVYQPVVDLESREIVGHEALARFDQPHDRGPAGWFDDAFRVGLGVKLEWLAVTQALPFLDSSADNGFLALNMSPATVLHIQDESLCQPGLYPQIIIELTEHVPIEDYSALHRSLEPMRAQGARLAADDLGAGYAGFRHLIGLEPDIIKLDISLVSGIHRSRGARALASALVAFANDVGATVIAEGVEDELEAAELRAIGVPWAQGYLLGKPEPRLNSEVALS